MCMIRLNPNDSTHTWKSVYRNFGTDIGGFSIKLRNETTKTISTIDPLSHDLSNGTISVTFAAVLEEMNMYSLELIHSGIESTLLCRTLAFATKQTDLENYSRFSGLTITAPSTDNTFIQID